MKIPHFATDQRGCVQWAVGSDGTVIGTLRGKPVVKLAFGTLDAVEAFADQLCHDVLMHRQAVDQVLVLDIGASPPDPHVTVGKTYRVLDTFEGGVAIVADKGVELDLLARLGDRWVEA